MTEHRVDLISAYADGELAPVEARALEAHLRECTECTRELALIRALGGALKATMSNPPTRSVWESVNARIARPIGWVLFTAGVAVWIALGVMQWYRERALTAEWLAGSAVVIGIVLLAVGVAYEQYREWKTTPYKDVHQ